MSNKKKVKKYRNGTSKQGVVRNYIESPDETLYENQLANAKADYKADINPWVQGLNLLGNAGIQYGASKNDNAGALGGGLASLLQLSNMFAHGGKVNNVPVEVEGKEVAETPRGQLMEFKGKSHEEGGIDLNLPVGTEVFSKRIKIDDVSMADRKKKRERKQITLEKLLENNKFDNINKNTLKRVKTNNEKKEQADLQVQQLIGALLDAQDDEQDRKKYGLGDIVKPNRRRRGYENWLRKQTGKPDYDFSTHSTNGEYNYNDFTKNYKNKDLSLDAYRKDIGGIFTNMTGGDWLSTAGNILSTFQPMINTKRQRAGDRPNVNYYENFGEDSLNVINQLKDYVTSQRDNALTNLETARRGNIQRNRNTARGVNSMRALDLAASAQANQAQSTIYDTFARQMMNVLSQQVNVENQQDSMFMQGEEKRDNANRLDRDNYYSQMAQNVATMGQGLQEIGKDINKVYSNRDAEKLIGQKKEIGLNNNQIKSHMMKVLKSKIEDLSEAQIKQLLGI